MMANSYLDTALPMATRMAPTATAMATPAQMDTEVDMVLAATECPTSVQA